MSGHPSLPIPCPLGTKTKPCGRIEYNSEVGLGVCTICRKMWSDRDVSALVLATARKKPRHKPSPEVQVPLPEAP
jgi:hypothetical protein